MGPKLNSAVGIRILTSKYRRNAFFDVENMKGFTSVDPEIAARSRSQPGPFRQPTQ
jgi:hypothetical protein